MSPAPSRFSDSERTFQSRYAVTGNHKVIAAAVGVERETISRYAMGSWPIPAYRAFTISATQENWVYIRSLAARAGALVLPLRPTLSHWSVLQILSHTVLSFGQFLTLAEDVNAGKTLTDEQIAELEQAGADLKAGVDALIEKARQQRANKE